MVFSYFSQIKKTWRFLHKYIPIESIYGIPSRELTHPIWGKGNHLQNAIFGGYVSSLGGIYLHLVDFYGKCRQIFPYMDPMGIDIQYAILAKKAFIHLPRSGVKKHKLNHLGKGKIFTVYTSEVEQFAPEKLPKPKKEVGSSSNWLHFQGGNAQLQVGKISRQEPPNNVGFPATHTASFGACGNPKLHT